MCILIFGVKAWIKYGIRLWISQQASTFTIPNQKIIYKDDIKILTKFPCLLDRSTYKTKSYDIMNPISPVPDIGFNPHSFLSCCLNLAQGQFISSGEVINLQNLEFIRVSGLPNILLCDVITFHTVIESKYFRGKYWIQGGYHNFQGGRRVNTGYRGDIIISRGAEG